MPRNEEPAFRGRRVQYHHRPRDDESTDFSDGDSFYDYSSDEESIDIRYRRPLPVREREFIRPPIAVPEHRDPEKPTYEAWNIFLSPGSKQVVGGWSVMGIKFQDFDQLNGMEMVVPETYEESELAGMHLQAVEKFQAKHRPCWAARVAGVKAKTYEDHLDEQCHKLPKAVQESISRLLADRDDAASTSFRKRTWTVVVLQEQLCARFAKPDPTEVKRHKVRFWKNPGPGKVEYRIVIRGIESKAALDKTKGFKTAARFENPWKRSDCDESMARSLAEQEKRQAKRREASEKKHTSPPSYRSGRDDSPIWESRVPLPEREIRRERVTDIPPPRVAYRTGPPPAPMRAGYGMGPPPLPMRAPPPPAPTPPRSYTPPPGVAMYNRPSVMVPPPLPSLRMPYPGPQCQVPTYPEAGYYGVGPQQPPARAPVLPQPPYNVFSSCFFPSPPALPSCLACRNSLCPHLAKGPTCFRPIEWIGSVATHPPCFLCARKKDENMAPSSPFAPMPLPQVSQRLPSLSSLFEDTFPRALHHSATPRMPPFKYKNPFDDFDFEAEGFELRPPLAAAPKDENLSKPAAPAASYNASPRMGKLEKNLIRKGVVMLPEESLAELYDLITKALPNLGAEKEKMLKEMENEKKEG
ncbi:hypothetical protein B0H63DRAFT_305119 [Podospora didyma]|uniref:Uncharacterized protein n=1 Tax=Podospora didyma TaxID=330526 RepID=A0AAE0K628_9PEZI|nr:hypothetical protein B0H63DRAFT_305119 [Podospora didyma]